MKLGDNPLNIQEDLLNACKSRIKLFLIYSEKSLDDYERITEDVYKEVQEIEKKICEMKKNEVVKSFLKERQLYHYAKNKHIKEELSKSEIVQIYNFRPVLVNPPDIKDYLEACDSIEKIENLFDDDFKKYLETDYAKSVLSDFKANGEKLRESLEKQKKESKKCKKADELKREANRKRGKCREDADKSLYEAALSLENASILITVNFPNLESSGSKEHKKIKKSIDKLKERIGNYQESENDLRKYSYSYVSKIINTHFWLNIICKSL